MDYLLLKSDSTISGGCLLDNINVLYVTTYFEIHQSAAGAETSNTSSYYYTGEGSLPSVSGKQTANDREAGQVVDSTDLCEKSKRNSQIEPCGRNGFCYKMVAAVGSTQ